MVCAKEIQNKIEKRKQKKLISEKSLKMKGK